MRDRVLAREFLRRLVDNDLISPDADRHQVLSATWAALVGVGLFVTSGLAIKYLFWPGQSPGPTAMVALDDMFLYTGGSMIVLGLVAAAEWNALALDARDVAVLLPLPMSRGAIVRAKIASLLLFAAAVALALNAIPSVVVPFLFATRLRIGLGGVARLIVVHAASTLAAGVFGFLVVLAVREVLRAVVGDRWFGAISAVAQAALVVVFASALLLLPAASSDVASHWLEAEPARAELVPPLWFAGMNEMLGGRLVADLPRGPERPIVAGWDTEGRARYRAIEPRLERLALTGMAALAGVMAIGLGAYLWNSRRFSAHLVSVPARRGRVAGALAAVATRVVVRRPAAQAGVFFALRALWRSVPHRLTAAAALALGLALSVVVLRAPGSHQAPSMSFSPRLLAVQTTFLAFVLAAFRHAARIPAELRANWTLRLAWAGHHDAYLSGVKRAAVVGLAAPVLLLLLPAHVMLMGWRLAVGHFAFGVGEALLLTDALFLNARKPAFACSDVPSGHVKMAGVIVVLMVALAVMFVSGVEWVLLQSAAASAIALAVVGALLVGLRTADTRLRRTPGPVAWDESPDQVTRLALLE